MRRALAVAILLATSAISGAADDAPPPPDKDASVEKPRLGGGFKGQPVAPASKASPAKAKPFPAGTRKPPARLTIDNSMVKKNSAPGGAVPAATPPTAAPVPAPSVQMPKVVDIQGHDEAYWRARAADVRGAVVKANSELSAAAAEEKREENDFYSWDDGQYRDNVIKPAWDRAREEAVKARQNLDAAQKQLDALEDDARKSGAYPGWIRE